jgi:endoglycosylceramidase
MRQQQKITIKDARFVDSYRRHVLLHGISVVNKDPHAGYFFDAGSDIFASMSDWGFNVIRLGVLWDGLEPEPGMYDEDYLSRLDQQISRAKSHNLYVFLDMHQDLYSVLYSDGAPAWATLTNGAPHVDLGGVWSDAYFTSPAVQIALDNFWANAPAPDGVGVQEHYARAWAHLAHRYADESTVIGYDIMNEPFPGSMAVQTQEMMFVKGAELIAALGVQLEGAKAVEDETHASSPVESLAEQWLTAEGRSAILQFLRNLDIYSQVIDVTHQLYAEFEQTHLMPMYHRVASAIRNVDSQTALYLETTMGSNMGVYSAIQPLMLDDERDPAQVYAPHGYDLVVDTPDIAHASPERVELIFQRHGETAKRLWMPMLVGEWGAYGRNPDTLPAAWHVVHQFEKLLCSETYWAYEPGMERFPCFQAVQRPYPERVAGILRSYHYDPKMAIFQCTWEEDGVITAPSRIYLPDWFEYADSMLDLTPQGTGMKITPTSVGSSNRYLEIMPIGTAVTRQILIKGRHNP